MNYEAETSQKRQVEMNNPATGRRVVATETTYTQQPERAERGLSPSIVALIVVGAVTLMGLIFFFVMNQRDQQHEQERAALEASERAAQQRAAEQQRPVIVQQPAPAPAQPPVVIQQTAPAPQSPSGNSGTSAPPSKNTGPSDMTIQTAVDEGMRADEQLAPLGISVTVLEGKVILLGTVPSSDLKRRAETMVKKVKGVRSVENQITVLKS